MPVIEIQDGQGRRLFVKTEHLVAMRYNEHQGRVMLYTTDGREWATKESLDLISRKLEEARNG